MKKISKQQSELLLTELFNILPIQESGVIRGPDIKMGTFYSPCDEEYIQFPDASILLSLLDF